MSARYNIRVHGCHDSTELHDVELTEAEHATVRRLVVLVDAASEYGCQPTMTVDPAPIPTTTTAAAPTAQTGA